MFRWIVASAIAIVTGVVWWINKCNVRLEKEKEEARLVVPLALAAEVGSDEQAALYAKLTSIWHFPTTDAIQCVAAIYNVLENDEDLEYVTNKYLGISLTELRELQERWAAR